MLRTAAPAGNHSATANLNSDGFGAVRFYSVTDHLWRKAPLPSHELGSSPHKAELQYNNQLQAHALKEMGMPKGDLPLVGQVSLQNLATDLLILWLLTLTDINFCEVFMQLARYLHGHLFYHYGCVSSCMNTCILKPDRVCVDFHALL